MNRLLRHSIALCFVAIMAANVRGQETDGAALFARLQFRAQEVLKSGMFRGTETIVFGPAAVDDPGLRAITERRTTTAATTILVGRGGSLRVEATSGARNGIPTTDSVESEKLNTIITTVDQSYSKRFNVISKSAVVRPGMSADPESFRMALGRVNPLRAGLPNMMRYRPEHIRKIEHEASEDGPVVKLTLVDEPKLGVGNVMILWVLPEKGFSVQRAKFFMLGHLIEEQSFSKFREIEPRRWYPLLQKDVVYTSVLPVAIEERLRAQTISIASDEVLQQQKAFPMVDTSFDLIDIDLSAGIDEAQFNQEFPPGTKVVDYTRPSKDGSPYYQYVVGAPLPKARGD